jgi:6-phospho-3-hexuloisomerase
MSTLQTVMREIEEVMKKMDADAAVDFARTLHQHEGRIFVLGEGRSGLMAKAFAMRLMHLGATVYVMGETITPSIKAGDMLVALSGSGTTSSVVERSVQARKLGCQVLGVTTDPDSPLADTCTSVLHIPAATKYRKPGETASIQPLSSLFDQASHIVLDSVCVEFAQFRNQTNEIAKDRHANME